MFAECTQSVRFGRFQLLGAFLHGRCSCSLFHQNSDVAGFIPDLRDKPNARGVPPASSLASITKPEVGLVHRLLVENGANPQKRLTCISRSAVWLRWCRSGVCVCGCILLSMNLYLLVKTVLEFLLRSVKSHVFYLGLVF